MAGHNRAARQKDTRQHCLLAENHLPRNGRAQFFFLDFVPRCFFWHVRSRFLVSATFWNLESSNESVAPSMPDAFVGGFQVPERGILQRKRRAVNARTKRKCRRAFAPLRAL